MFTGKVTTLPFLHASQPDKPNANFGSSAAFKTALDSSTIAVQGEANGLIDQLNSTTPGSSGSESLGSATIVGVAGNNPNAQMTDLKAQIVGMALGLIPDGTITLAKMATDVQNKLNLTYSLEREVANLKAASTIANRVDGASGTFYDLNDGLNGGSAGKIDMSSTNATGVITASASPVTVPITGGTLTTGLAVGMEVTIRDGTLLERRNITGLVASTSLTFAAMTNTYSAKAQICRSSVIQDTINHLLKFNGWTYLTTFTNTAVSVVASAYDTSGNGGRKIVQTTNGWLISIEVNGTTIQVQKSIDNGSSFQALCSITGAQVGAAIAFFGNTVTILWNNTTTIYSNTFDVTTVTNVDQNPNKVTLPGTFTAVSNNVSIAVKSTGIMCAAISTKTAGLPNSFNVLEFESTTSAVTAWAASSSLTADNTAGTDSTNACIVVKSNNNAVVVYQRVTSTTWSILVQYFSGTWTAAGTPPYPAAVTQAQANPCASVAPSGRIWCGWHGLDATDTTANNVRYSYSDDGGATWLAAVKLTSGNTYHQYSPVISIDKNNNVYILWYGIDAASGSFFNIYRNIWTGSAFQGATKLTTNTTASAMTMSSIDNNTLDFTLLTPPMIYKDSQAVAVKFSGTYIATTTTPVLVEDVRYNINPPANVSSAVAWVDHDADPNYSIAGAISFQAGAGNESFTNMTKTTAAIDGTHNEDQFVGSGTSAAKATLRLTMTRNSTALNKSIQTLLGAVGA